MKRRIAGVWPYIEMPSPAADPYVYRQTILHNVDAAHTGAPKERKRISVDTGEVAGPVNISPGFVDRRIVHGSGSPQ